jgi:hypothetical protein
MNSVSPVFIQLMLYRIYEYNTENKLVNLNFSTIPFVAEPLQDNTGKGLIK